MEKKIGSHKIKFTNSTLFGLLLFFFGFWDVYDASVGLRPLDFLGFGLLLLGLFFVPKFQVPRNDLVFLTALWLWLIVYSYIGILDDPSSIKLAFGMMAGMAVFQLTYVAKIDFDAFSIFVNIFLVANMLWFFAQFIYYYLSGEVLPPFFLDVLEPRALSSIFRPTGLYLEPASYSFTMLLFLVIRFMIMPRIDFIFALVVFTVLLSFSLWGMVAWALVMLIMLIGYKNHNIILWPVVILLIFYSGLLADEFVALLDRRLSDLSNDGSAITRYGNLLKIKDLNISITEIFGNGFSHLHGAFAYNSAYFMVYGVGLFGLGVFFLCISHLKNSHMSLRKYALLFVFMTAAPMWNTFVWWFWLALFISVPFNPALSLGPSMRQ